MSSQYPPQQPPQWSGQPPLYPSPAQPGMPQPYPPSQGYPVPGYPQQQAPYAPPSQPYPPGYPQQQMPYSPPQPQMMQSNIHVNVQQQGGPGFLVRALYFLFVGWWLGLVWLHIGFMLCCLVVTLPLGLIMLNRMPQIMTLKPSNTSTTVNVSNTMMSSPGGPLMQTNVNVTVGGQQQHNFLVRAIYFVLIGCWAGYLWAWLAYFCCFTVFLLPVGFIMFNSLPAVLTLRRN